MADPQTPSPGTSSSPSNGAKPEKVNIPMSGGGGFGLDTFLAATDQKIPNEITDRDEAEEAEEASEKEEGVGELLDPDPKDEETETEEESDEEGEETEEDEDSDSGDTTDLEELSKTTKKGIKATTKDGKQVTLPPDLEIEQVVDGETRKINLRDHLNVVAGEMTVESRLGKLSSFRQQVEDRRLNLERVHGKFNEDINTLVSFAKEGKPDLAICFLAEMNGMSPIDMKKQFLKALVTEATKFEGKTEVEIENYYLNLDRQWRDRKALKSKEATDKQTQANNWVGFVTSELKKENISPEDFTSATTELSNGGALKGLDRERALDRVIEHALLKRHVNMAENAIQGVDPKLKGNKKLMNLLLEFTHPNKFTVDEMADVLREYLGKATTRIASSLSKKVQPQQVMTKSEKQNGAGQKKLKTYRSQGDLARAFGLG